MTLTSVCYCRSRQFLQSLFGFLRPFCLYSGTIFAVSCASQQAPTGGPEDKTPPRIIKVFPDSAATNVSTKVIRLTFDKYIQPSTVQPALFFSPALEGETEIKTYGKEVEITLDSTLKPNRTYSYTVTNSLQDTRGNGLDKSYSYAFTTGAVLDSGGIGGIVYDASSRAAQGVLVMAYLLDGTHVIDSAGVRRDTLSPFTTKPDYLAQTDAKGRFELRYLKASPYRLVAIRDANTNLLYDLNAEQYAVPVIDTLTMGMPGVQMRLAKTDTTKPELQSAEAKHQNAVAVRFDRNLLMNRPDEPSFHLNFSVFDSTAKQPVFIRSYYTERQNGRDIIYLVTDSLPKPHTFGLVAKNLRDSLGNRAETLSSSFSGSDVRDTNKAVVQNLFADSTRNIFERTAAMPDGRWLALAFRAPVLAESVRDNLSLRKLNGSTATALPIVFRTIDAKRVEVKPAGEFQLGSFYEFTLDHRGIRDAFGRPTLDSVFVRRFEIVGEEMFGGIEGEVSVETPAAGKIPVGKTDSSKSVVVNAELVGTGFIYTKRLPLVISPADKTSARRSTKFEFINLPEGRYTINAFLTADSSGGWNTGSAFPYRIAARFGVGSDSVRVRKRWTTSDVNVVVP